MINRVGAGAPALGTGAPVGRLGSWGSAVLAEEVRGGSTDPTRGGSSDSAGHDAGDADLDGLADRRRRRLLTLGRHRRPARHGGLALAIAGRVLVHGTGG